MNTFSLAFTRTLMKTDIQVFVKNICFQENCSQTIHKRMPSTLRLYLPNVSRPYPAGIWCQNDVVLTSMRRDDVASTLIRCHFGTKCPLGILSPMRQGLFLFSGAGKFCLALWLRQLTRDVKSDVRTYISEVTSLMLHHKKRQIAFSEDRWAT